VIDLIIVAAAITQLSASCAAKRRSDLKFLNSRPRSLPHIMLVDDKNDNRPPPDYSELPHDHYHQQGDYRVTTSTSGGAHARSRSVLYNDMNDPFSNHAAVASTSGVRDVDDDDGYIGQQNMLATASGTSPPRGVGANAGASTTLRAVSPHSFEYVAPQDIPDDESFRERRRSSVGDAAGGGLYDTTTGSRGPRPLSASGGPRNSFYDAELYDQENSFQRSPTNSLRDTSPLVDNSGIHNNLSSSGTLVGEFDTQQHRGMQPLGAGLVNLWMRILPR
jgi:hypothetical protein